MSSLAARTEPAGLSAQEKVVYDFCCELHGANKVSEPTFARAEALFGKAGVMDLTGTCGYYGMLAMVLNVAERPLEPGSVPFGS